MARGQKKNTHGSNRPGGNDATLIYLQGQITRCQVSPCQQARTDTVGHQGHDNGIGSVHGYLSGFYSRNGKTTTCLANPVLLW